MRKRTALFAGGVVMLMWAGGCRPGNVPAAAPVQSERPAHAAEPVAALRRADLSDPSRPLFDDLPVTINAARNEWISFSIQLAAQVHAGDSIRLTAPKSNAGVISTASFQAYQVLSIPVDADRAAYVRHTGLAIGTRTLPRALLPLKIDAEGRIALRSLRSVSGTPPLIWVDLHVPATASAGAYASTVELAHEGSQSASGALPVRLTVYNFNLPNERHLQMVGRLGWDRLEKLYPEHFETFTPSWVNRRDSKYADTVKTIDQLMAVAQAHRLALVIPALRPVTKWPAGAPPEIEWRDFDSLVGPWLDGGAFADHTALRFWPLPPAEMLERYDRKSRLEYWAQAALHFDQNKWLGISAVSLEGSASDPTGEAQADELSLEAAEILKAYPRLRVLLPLRDERLRLADSANPALIDPAATARLLTASPPLVSSPPANEWPANVTRPQHWLQTDLPGVVPYAGAGGSERDVRLWAWLAFLRHVSAYGKDAAARDENYILWDSTLPGTAALQQPADPNELVWSYPGEWFGVDQPVPTIQLKWLRRAQQDYEYLRLARERGEAINALQMARLLTRPVEVQPGQAPDPVYSLMSGTEEPRVWDEAQSLLADSILLHSPGENLNVDRQEALYIRTMQWAIPRERPLLVARSADWSVATSSDTRERGNWIDLKLGLDIYNASETTPDQSRLAWSQVPAGWQIHPQEQAVPRLSTYHVTRSTLSQKFNLDQLSPAARQPMELQIMDDHRQNVSRLRLVLPVAASDRREGRLSLDGNLEDWAGSDPIQDGPMIRMSNRPALQKQEIQAASVPAHLYSAWARENFYFAFALEGLSPQNGRGAHNFVDYQQRRAWGEDLCEMLIQPLLANGSRGPVLHVICKPNGVVIVERKSTGGPPGAWQAIEGASVRYATTSGASAWQGEIAIPWSLIAPLAGNPPPLLRFNFTQHRAATGESASWAGPVDYGRDDEFMGLLYVRSPDLRQLNNIVQERGGR